MATTPAGASSGIGGQGATPDVGLLQDLLDLHECGEAVVWPQGLNAEGAKKIILSYEFKQKEATKGKGQTQDKKIPTSAAASAVEEEEDCEEVYIEAFRCPITQQRMRDPTMTPSGHSYDGPAIRQVARDRGSSPQTNRRLRTFDLLPNRALAEAIAQVRRLQKEQKEASQAASEVVPCPAHAAPSLEVQSSSSSSSSSSFSAAAASASVCAPAPSMGTGASQPEAASAAPPPFPTPTPKAAADARPIRAMTQTTLSSSASPMSQPEAMFATPAPRQGRAAKKQPPGCPRRGILELLAWSPGPSPAAALAGGSTTPLGGATPSSLPSSQSGPAPPPAETRQTPQPQTRRLAAADLTTPAPRRKRALSSEALSSSRKRNPPTAGRGKQ